jgi:hypothetical protein
MTEEDFVAYALWEMYLSFPRVEIISFHPPSGKAYDTPLVRFPNLKNLGGASKRKHLDFIVRCGRFLILQELKGAAGSSKEDQAKLLALHDELGTSGIVRTIAKRVPAITKLPKIDRIVLSLGFSTNNATVSGPFTTVCVDKMKNTTWHWGSDLTSAEIAELSGYFTSP